MKVKNIIAVFCSVLLCFSFLTTGSSAFETVMQEKEYIIFHSPQERIDSDGSFSFYFHQVIQSDSVVATSNYLEIRVNAKLYNVATGTYTTNGSEFFTITLKKDGWLFDSTVGTLQARTNGSDFKADFTGIDSGSKYYFVLTPVNENLGMTSYYISGSGTISPVTLP